MAWGFIASLEKAGHDVRLMDIGEVGDVQGREIATGFAVCSAVAQAIQTARRECRFPIVLAGNCLTAAGAVAGEAADSIVWFDQHGDLNTPETSAYGFLDGMALAVTLGICWRPMTAVIPGFRPIQPEKCILVDARDLDPDEKALLTRIPVRHVPARRTLEEAKDLIAKGIKRLHVHLDLDVHDPARLAVNRYITAGGPSPDELRKIIAEMFRVAPISGMTITAYDPAVDPEGEVPESVCRLFADCLPVTAVADTGDT